MYPVGRLAFTPPRIYRQFPWRRAEGSLPYRREKETALLKAVPFLQLKDRESCLESL